MRSHSEVLRVRLQHTDFRGHSLTRKTTFLTWSSSWGRQWCLWGGGWSNSTSGMHWEHHGPGRLRAAAERGAAISRHTDLVLWAFGAELAGTLTPGKPPTGRQPGAACPEESRGRLLWGLCEVSPGAWGKGQLAVRAQSLGVFRVCWQAGPGAWKTSCVPALQNPWGWWWLADPWCSLQGSLRCLTTSSLQHTWI